LSLGQGIHYCLGAALARTEARIFFSVLRRTMPTLRLAHEGVEVAWQRKVAVRGLQSLRVTAH
jgi:cytochrome P450